MFGLARKKEPKQKVFHFFETVSHSFFVVIVGLFITIFLGVFGFSVVFFNPLYNQIALFTLVGAIFFSVSYRLFLTRNGLFLRNLTYANFLVARRKLLGWVIYTFNFYLLLVWFTLIVLGATDGFNVKFPTDDNKNALIVTDAQTTKILGFVLLCVHMFLFISLKILVYYWDRLLGFATRELEKRRKSLETVRSRAETL